MPFSGLSTYDQFTAAGGSLIQEDVSATIKRLSIRETPVLEWLGDPDPAGSILHEFVESELRPNYLTTASAVNSATAATGIQLTGMGDLVTVGTILENESTAPEVMQVSSVVGPNSVLVTRNYGGGGIGSLVTASRLFVRAPLALEGQDPSGDVSRPRRRKATYLKFFQLPITVSLTQQAVTGLGGITDEYEEQKAQRILEIIRDYEKEVIRGVASGNSIGSETLYRSFNGMRASIGSINSTVITASFSANPHLYLGNVWKNAFDNGLRSTDEIGIIAGASAYRDISNLNDTKVQDSNQSEDFKRVITTYQGPFGRARVILSPWMPDYGVLGVSRSRVRPVVLTGRSFRHIPVAQTGSAMKGMVEGEYGLEVHNPQTMFQLRIAG